jgi:hypothetical protein
MRLDLGVSGLPGGTAVGAFSLDFQFAPSLLADFSFGPYLGDPAQAEALNDTILDVGQVDLRATSVSVLSNAELEALQPFGFLLGALVVTPLSAGTWTITVDGVLSDGFGRPLDVSFEGTTLTTETAIPESASVLLMFSGLVAIMAFRSWR